MLARARNVVALTSLMAIACAPESAPEPEAAPEPETTASAAELPAPEADAVWAYLQAEEYRANWGLWPERGQLYTGQEPHGMLLTTYVNAIAADALADGAGAMPAGAIIVKENFMPDSTFAAATVMYKSPGFDAENNDWWWLKRNADGSVDAAGKGEGCINCHRGMADNDYVWTSQLGQGQ